MVNPEINNFTVCFFESLSFCLSDVSGTKTDQLKNVLRVLFRVGARKNKIAEVLFLGRCECRQQGCHIIMLPGKASVEGQKGDRYFRDGKITRGQLSFSCKAEVFGYVVGAGKRVGLLYVE